MVTEPLKAVSKPTIPTLREWRRHYRCFQGLEQVSRKRCLVQLHNKFSFTAPILDIAWELSRHHTARQIQPSVFRTRAGGPTPSHQLPFWYRCQSPTQQEDEVSAYAICNTHPSPWAPALLAHLPACQAPKAPSLHPSPPLSLQHHLS